MILTSTTYKTFNNFISKERHPLEQGVYPHGSHSERCNFKFLGLLKEN
jgi:hypothetical protein